MIGDFLDMAEHHEHEEVKGESLLEKISRIMLLPLLNKGNRLPTVSLNFAMPFVTLFNKDPDFSIP